MKLSSIAVALPLVMSMTWTGAVAGADLDVSFEAPSFFVKGEPFVVEVRYEAGDEGTLLSAWQLGMGMFEVDGQPLDARENDATVPLPARAVMTVLLDLKDSLTLTKGFQLGVAGATTPPIEVSVFELAPEGLDFLTMPLDQLAGYEVLLRTNQGSMLLEFWPDLAPNHVRNFLDLSYTGFYDNVLFHRVSPNFMIQGGCPNTKAGNQSSWGTGRGPRMLDAEFSDTPHERGVLSMARGNSPSSASSQFFVMTARNKGLDGKYSVFGQMVWGEPALTKISSAAGITGRDGTTRPDEPQRIERATVLKPIQ